MLANQSDFMAYAGALKSNYRKGVHRLETILSNPTHAAEFAANLGGVSVILGVPVSMPDRNSDKLLELLLGSAVADNAVETWLHQFYEFTDWDDLLSDSARCQEMANNPLIWRAAGGSKLAVGKSVATLAGLSCSAYKDIDAVVASSTAMTAIIANSTALNAVVTSSTAMAAIQKSPTARNAIAASSMATAKYAAGAAGLNPADYADMKAVAASSTAMAAVAASSTAMAAIAASATARAAICASTVAYDYLLSKATYATISGTYSNMGWSTRYEKPCIVLQWCFSHNGGTVGIRTCLDGAASRTYQGSQRYNSSMGSGNFNSNAKVSGTYYKEFVFCSKLETYNSQSDWPAISIAYFPLP
nr:MAG TPA: Tail fiber protein [Caudoviricetes sp.]